MPSSVSSHRLSGASTTSAPQTAWWYPPGTNASKASSLACPPGPCPQSWPRAMASVRATLSPTARATAVATWATSRAWVRRVRWWSSGKTKTWVLPARRRNAVACRMRSRSRSKQVRSGSGASARRRRPAPLERVAPPLRVASSWASRTSRPTTDPTISGWGPDRWATTTPRGERTPRIVAAQSDWRGVGAAAVMVSSVPIPGDTSSGLGRNGGAVPGAQASRGVGSRPIQGSREGPSRLGPTAHFRGSQPAIPLKVVHQ